LISALRSVDFTYRMAMKSAPWASPASKIGMTFGWSSPAASSDSAMNRSRKLSSIDSSGARTFSAAFRFSRRSSARYTTLIPPRPSRDSIR
jgi:hypothetical protein